jgi:Cu(I)/Ag(I) efflux system membrane fusion protein
VLPVLAVLALTLAATAVAAPPASAASADAFTSMMGDYEAVRLALVGDGVADVDAHARALAATARDLAAGFSAERAGVKAGVAGDARALLPEIAAAADRLAAAGGLEAARDAFFELSKPLVRYRALVDGEPGVVVAYCEMAKRSWLQPEGEIGNPYYGRSMARCGEVVDG